MQNNAPKPQLPSRGASQKGASHGGIPPAAGGYTQSPLGKAPPRLGLAKSQDGGSTASSPRRWPAGGSAMPFGKILLSFFSTSLHEFCICKSWVIILTMGRIQNSDFVSHTEHVSSYSCMYLRIDWKLAPVWWPMWQKVELLRHSWLQLKVLWTILVQKTVCKPGKERIALILHMRALDSCVYFA